MIVTLKYLYTTKNIFQSDNFLYSLCPNLEGTKDALFYKFRRLIIGQNCSALCTKEGGHRDAFSSKWYEALYVLERPAQQATEPRAKREARSVLCHSLAPDGSSITYGEFKQLLLACSEGCGQHHNN